MDTTTTWLVSKVGNDANSGHPSTYPINLANDAKLTIGAAVAAAASGDTIIIWPGTYAENVVTTDKALNISGIQRSLCKIAPATGIALNIGSDTKVCNLNLEALQVAASIWGLRIGTGAINTGNNCVVDNCICNGYYDGVTASYGRNLRFSNSIFIGGDPIATSSAERIIIDNCILSTSDPVVDTANDHSAYMGSGGLVIMRNTILRAIREDAVAKGLRGLRIGTVAGYYCLDNCIIDIYMPSATGIAYGVHISTGGGKVVLNNCTFRINAPNASDKADIFAEYGSVVVNNCQYNTVKGTVKVIDSDATRWLQQNAPVGIGL